MTPGLAEKPGPSAGRWRDCLPYRELLWTLALREIKVRYKQAVLGIAWAILQPLSLMVAFTLFFAILLRVPSDGVPYPLFVYVALVPWTFFASALSSAIPSLTNNVNLITKVYFPRAILPLASVLAAAVDFGIGSLVFVGMMGLYQTPISVYLLFIPVILFAQLILTVGVVLGCATLNVFYRDVRHAVPLLIQLWMFATPVIYPISVVPERLRILYLMNPMAGIIDSYRRTVLQGLPPDFLALGLAFLTSSLLLFVSWGYFRRAEQAFADVI